MYFSVPVRSGVTITDTPIEARSIRSFYFVDRTGKNRFYTNSTSDSGRIRCNASIYIDGKAICDNLFILPFMDTQLGDSELFEYDYRKICIPCLKNVNLSEVKIVADEDCEMDYEVVFECSDVAVEEERFLNIESFFIPFEKYDGRYRSLTMETRREADRFFFYQIQHQERGDKKELMETLTNATFTWKSETEETPENTPINLMSCGFGVSWKEAIYYLSIPFTKHLQLNLWYPYNIPIQQAVVLFLAHEDKF